MVGHPIKRTRGLLVTHKYTGGGFDWEIVPLNPDKEDTSAFFKDRNGQCFLWREGIKNTKNLCVYKPKDDLEVTAQLLPTSKNQWMRVVEEVTQCSS